MERTKRISIKYVPDIKKKTKKQKKQYAVHLGNHNPKKTLRRNFYPAFYIYPSLAVLKILLLSLVHLYAL